MLILVGLIVVVGALAVVAARSSEGTEGECTTDIPCQECGQCYGDHFNASITNGHSYRYPRDLHR